MSSDALKPEEPVPATSPADPASAELPLIAYALPGIQATPIVPGPVSRPWMRETHKQFAHRCLPLLMANQSGWLLLNMQPVRVTWDGGSGAGSLRIENLGEEAGRLQVSSQFGHGILTWVVDYLFRTPPGYNLLVRGPANLPKDGIQALEGLVETDWAVATFTMNWKMTRADHPVTFEAGEPFCMVVPQRRHELERFAPRTAPIEQERELYKQWSLFHNRRMLMIGARHVALSKGGRAAWDKVPFERHYFEGTSPGGWSADEHQTKRSLRPFPTPVDAGEPESGGG
jgi:hypothetical protein